VFEAIQPSGKMLRYASAALQNCQQVVLETVRQDGMIPCSAREVLKNDSKRRCAAGELLLNSPPIALEVVGRAGSMLSFPREAQVVLAAVGALEYLRRALLDNRSFLRHLH